MRNFAEQLKAEIQRAIKTKPVTKFGPVNSSGRLHDSVEIKYTDSGFQILAFGYIFDLIYGVRPGETKATIGHISKWIQEKPLKSEIPTGTLAMLILNKQKKEGNMVWRTHKGANSGLLTEALSQDKFDRFVDLLASESVDKITDQIVNAFEMRAA